MNTQQAIKEMLEAWNAIVAAAKNCFPSASDEEIYQIAKRAMNNAMPSKP